MSDTPSPASKLAESVTLKLVSRGAMIFATVIGLPIAGWMMNRAVGSVDEISKKIDVVHDQAMETNGALKLMKQSQESQSQLLADHEIRVRALESFNRAMRP